MTSCVERQSKKQETASTKHRSSDCHRKNKATWLFNRNVHDSHDHESDEIARVNNNQEKKKEKEMVCNSETAKQKQRQTGSEVSKKGVTKKKPKTTADSGEFNVQIAKDDEKDEKGKTATCSG